MKKLLIGLAVCVASSVICLPSGKEIEGFVLDRLDTEGMPQGDIRESIEAVYAAIAASDIQLVKDSLRVLDHNNFFELELVLRGFKKASSQLVDDYTEDLSLPRTTRDKVKLLVGTGMFIGSIVVVRYLDSFIDKSKSFKGNEFALGLGFLGFLSVLGSPYLLWKCFHRSEQRALLARAVAVHEHIVMRLDKVVSQQLSVKLRQLPNKEFEKAVKVSDLDKVQALVWDLECLYLDGDAQQEIIDRAATYAAEGCRNKANQIFRKRLSGFYWRVSFLTNSSHVKVKYVILEKTIKESL